MKWQYGSSTANRPFLHVVLGAPLMVISYINQEAGCRWAGGLVGWGGAKVPCLPARNPPIGRATQRVQRGTARQPPPHSSARWLCCTATAEDQCT